MTISQDAELAKADYSLAIKAARYQLTESCDIEFGIAADAKLFRRCATQRKGDIAMLLYFAPIFMNRLCGLTDPLSEKKHTHRRVA